MRILLLHRPVGTKELQFIEQTGWRMFQPRLPEPIAEVSVNLTL
jgi:hypothetical protein